MWTLYTPVAVLYFIRFLKNREKFIEKNLNTLLPNSNLIFQITTRSATKTPVVKRGILSVIESCTKVKLRNYHISIITDDPEDKRTLKSYPCEIVVVEKYFKTNAIKKGRALQYAVEHRRLHKQNSKNYWIFHMDDESFVTEQTILSLLKFMNKKGHIAGEGPIFYPLKFESANPLTAMAESIRPYTCYDCVSQMTNPPPLHMHGSNLLVRSDVEDKIEWKFGPTLAEDQMFGYKISERYGEKSMGWHGGVLLEQPPLNIKDHFLQRRRWIIGALQNLSNFDSKYYKLKHLLKILSYFFGFASAVSSMIYFLSTRFAETISTLVTNFNYTVTYQITLQESITTSFNGILNQFVSNSFISLLSKTNPLEIGIGTMLVCTSFIWLASYQIGLFLNLRYSGLPVSKRVFLHIQTFVICPIIGLVETFPAFYAIIEYIFKKRILNSHSFNFDFHVINK